MRPEPAGGGIGVTGGTEILEQGEGGAGLGHGDLGRIGVHRLGQQHPRPPHLQRHLEEREGSQRLLEVGLLALEALGELGWKPVHGNAIAPGSGERLSWDELVIPARLLEAMRALNPTVPMQYLQQALAEITSPKSRTRSPRTTAFTATSWMASGASATSTPTALRSRPRSGLSAPIPTPMTGWPSTR